MFILILVAGLAALVVLVVILELYVQYRRKKLKELELEQQKPEETVSFRPVKAEDMPEEITDLSHIKAYGKKIRRR